MKKSAVSMLLAALMAASGVFSGVGTTAHAAGANNSPEKPTDLKVEMLEYAYGINTKNPSFSWVVNDSDKNEIQSAYRIVVSSTSALAGDVHDTGWVDSSESSYVHADALEGILADNELYYWQVQTKDKDGAESPLSDARPFMTDISSEWQSLNGIWSTPNAGKEEDAQDSWQDYTVEQTISIQSGNAFGILIRMSAEGNGYMVQIRDADNVLRVQKVEGATVSKDIASEINLSDSGITLPVDASEFKLKITAQDSILSFAVATDMSQPDNYTEVGTADISGLGNFTSGRIGYRTGMYESGTVSALKVTSLDDGGILYESDFSDDDGMFSGCTVSEGKLQVGKSTYSVYPAEVFNWDNYAVEQTMAVIGGDALAMLLRTDESTKDGYMAQVRTADNVIKLHKIDGGTVNSTAFQEIRLSDSGITLPTDGSEFRVKAVMEGSVFSFAIDTQAADGSSYQEVTDTVDISGQGNLLTGQFGYRTGRTESGTIDDIKVTSKSGSVVYESSFDSDDAKFSGCSVQDGRLVVGNSAFSVFSTAEDGKLTELSNFSFFRSPRLTVDKETVDKAIVSIASRGTAMDRGIIADIFMNGQCLGAGSARELANVGSYGGTSSYTQVYYNSYDVTDILGYGDENVISVIGNCRDSNRGILVQMTVFYNDGSKEILTNSGVEGSGWKTLDGTNAFGDKGDGITTGYVTLLHENINANEYPAGWNEVDFDDSEWAPAQVNTAVADVTSGTSGRVLYPYSSENPLRVETNEETKKVYVNDSGNVVVDLGKEIIGGMRIGLETASEQKVTVHMGEEMNDDGTVKWQLTAVPKYEDVWTLAAGENCFDTVTMRNFRYVEFIGLDAATQQNLVDNPDSVTGWAIQQEFDESESSYEATDGSEAAVLMNRLYELCKYTIQATNQDVFVDSQARERAPYEGDLLVNSNTSYAVSGNYSLARHSNEWLMDNETWPNDYRIFSVEMTYWDYIYTGNIDSLKENYSALKRKLTAEVEYEDAATGLIRANGSQAGNSAIIDWPTSERDGYQGSYYDVVFNAEYVGIYKLMATLSTALGEMEDAAYYTEKSEKLKETLLTYAYDEANGCFYDSLDQSLQATKHSSTHATAYALTYGVFENQAMADDMCEFVYNQCKEEFKGSVYVTYFILKGLYVGNHGEYAEALMTNPKVGENVKTFASLLDDLNCTITPEAWGHQWKGNMTLSHPWGASPGCSIVQGTFGILPTKAGFEEFDIKLQPGEIDSAEVKAPTVKGTVEASYTNAGTENGIEATVTIPVNTKAKVYMPVTNKNLGYLLVDGEKTEAVNYGNYLMVELGSGTWNITISDEEVGYKPYLDITASAETTELETDETALITAKVTDQFGSGITADDGLKLTYKSTDESVLTVDENGVVTALKAGAASVTITAEYMEETKSASIDFTVVQAPLSLKDFVLELNCGDMPIGVDKTTQATLKAVYNDGHEEIIDSSMVTFTVEGDAASIDENGVVTGLKEGEAVITATTKEKVAELTKRFATERIQVETVWEFDNANSPLSGVEVKDGSLYAAKGQKVQNVDADKQGSVVSGSFTIESVAANIAFNAQDDNNRYFWQFRTDGTLKKHKGNADVFGDLVPIKLKDGENTFLIATIEGKIYTYLNEELIDICDADPMMPASGGFGVRNGMSESFYINSLSVGSGLSFTAQNTVSVTTKQLPTIQSVENPADILVTAGTAWEELNLPSQVKVTLSDGVTKEVAVTWSGDYNADVPGDYNLTGTLTEDGSFENPNGVQAALKITVQQVIQEPTVITDEETNVTVEAEAGVIPDGTVLVVDVLNTGEIFEECQTALKDICEKFTTYQVQLLNGNAEVDLQGSKVVVKIPVPEGYDMASLLFYQLNADGELVPVAFRCEDGQIIFETDILGVFVAGEKKAEEPTDPDNPDKPGDNNNSTTGAGTGAQDKDDSTVKTGDDKYTRIYTFSLIGALVVMGCVGGGIVYRRRKK